MSAAAVLAAWMTHSVVVERIVGSTSGGAPVFGEPEALAAFVDPGESYVRGTAGESVLSTATCYLPVTVETIPVGSRVGLPTDFGGRVAIVVQSAHRRSGRGTPDHLEVKLT
jgi:hypothetical protein